MPITYQYSIVGTPLVVPYEITATRNASFGWDGLDGYVQWDWPGGPVVDGAILSDHSGVTQNGGGVYPDLSGQLVYRPQTSGEADCLMVTTWQQAFKQDGRWLAYSIGARSGSGGAWQYASGWDRTGFLGYSPSTPTVLWYGAHHYCMGPPYSPSIVDCVATFRRPDGQLLYDTGLSSEYDPLQFGSYPLARTSTKTAYPVARIGEFYIDGATAPYDDPGTVRTFSGTITLYPYADVWLDTSITIPGSGGAAGLSMDRHPFGPLRLLYNVGFDSAALALRRHYGLDGTPSDVALSFTGQSPSILCRADGTHLAAVSDGTNIQIRRISDEGEVLDTMPSPGPGKLCSIWESKSDSFSPLWVAYCTADTGTGAEIKVYRTTDAVGLTGWESAVSVPTGGKPGGFPAQKPAITGDASRLVISVHNGTSIELYVSTDNGATWGLSS